MSEQVVERYWSVFMRYLPLLRILDAKKYGWLIVQIHGRRPVRVGFLPGLEAVNEVDRERGEASDITLSDFDNSEKCGTM